uniref:Uncharacterized protein n=1 Tax=Lygus hesperus TaxID=30085 RepID=A0A146M607_LYGHE
MYRHAHVSKLFVWLTNKASRNALLSSCVWQSSSTVTDTSDRTIPNDATGKATDIDSKLGSKALYTDNFHPGPRPYSRAAQKLSRGRRGPMKDRYPPMAVDLGDRRRRLAVLIDATSTRLLPRP